MGFCDLQCRHARWPESEGLDGSGSCRTFQALYCRKKKRLVHKNAPCADKEGAPAEVKAPGRVVSKKPFLARDKGRG